MTRHRRAVAATGVAASTTDLYVSDPGSDTIFVYSYTSGPATPLTLPANSYPTDMAISSDGQYLYVIAQAADLVYRFDLTTTNAPDSIGVADGA